MKFNKAVYVNGNKTELLDIDEIAKRVDFVSVVSHIYCPGKDCKAKLVFKKVRTGKYYLSRQPTYHHGENCDYLSEPIFKERALTTYIEINGNISTKGINRRKNEGLEVLDEFLHPELKKNKRRNPSRTISILEKSDHNINERPKIKINYDPNAGVVTSQTMNGEGKIQEPPFFWRLPSQITKKDSNKNLKTAGKITKITIGSDERSCEIQTKLQGVSILFKLPESFFEGNLKRTSADQLVNFLKILEQFIEKKHTEIYLVTMCQSQVIDENNIVLYVLDPEFLSFLTKDERKYNSLTKVAVAISSKMLK